MHQAPVMRVRSGSENRRDVARNIEDFLDRHADTMTARLERWSLGQDDFVLSEIASGRLRQATADALSRFAAEP